MIPRLAHGEPAPALCRDFLDTLAAQGFSGELRHDLGTRLVTATDNSVYQVTPQAVVYPRTAEDIQRVLKLAAEPRFQEIKITARGGGTGTNGQSLSPGITLDVSRHLNRILEVNLKEGWVRVQPGVVLDQLNDHLAPHGVFFAPNLSPSSRATLGGMINTDACGKGSRIYGRTSDHVLELTCVLSDGSTLEVEPWQAEALAAVKAGDGLAGSAIRKVDEIVTEKAEAIERVFPKLSRFLTGYNLAKVYDNADGYFNLNYLLAGSEGTLAVVTEAKLRLTPLPKFKELLVVKYERFDDALAAAELLVESDPAAIETIDEKILELAKEDEIYPKVRDFLTDEGDRPTRTINLVEFIGDTPEQLSQKITELCAQLDANRSAPGQATGYYRTTTPGEMGDLWNLRKKGVGLLGNTKGARKPIPFVEDTCVPPKNLAAYIREFRALLESYGLDYAMFGHVDVGCLHVRPALDLQNPEHERWFREVSDGVMQLVRKHGGVMWGEHGRGFRSEYTPEFFGELYPDLRRVKEAFDPCNRLNPGKIVTPLSSPDQPIGVDGPLRGQQDRQIHPELRSEFDAAVSCVLPHAPHGTVGIRPKAGRGCCGSGCGNFRLQRGKVPKPYQRPIGWPVSATSGASATANTISRTRSMRRCPAVSPARLARRNARSMWTCRSSAPSSSTATTPAICGLCGTTLSAAPNGADAGCPGFPHLPTCYLAFPLHRRCSGASAWWTCRTSAPNPLGHDCADTGCRWPIRITSSRSRLTKSPRAWC